MTESRDRLAGRLEDEYWNDLESTGECKALDLTLPSLYYRAWRKYGDIRFCAVGGYLCDLINAELEKVEWD